MAGRTSTGVGVGVAVTLLAVAALGFFITTIIFFSKAQAAEKKQLDLEQGTRAYVTDQERESDNVRLIKDAAEGKSVVGYLVDANQDLITAMTGNAKDSAAAAIEKAKKVGAETTSLVDLVRQRDGEITALNRRVTDAEQAMAAAQQDRENEANRVKAIQQSTDETMASMSADVNSYKDQVDQYQQDLNTAKADMDARVDRIRQESSDTEASLRAQISDLQNDSVLDKSTIARLQSELKGQRVEGQAEFALVDGQIIGLDAGSGNVIINRGKRDKIVLGMPFEVYTEATAIRPDASGNYPSGKASLEVVKIDESTATCRVLTEKRGNPVVKGDVVANAVYDPSKVYKFLVYGNFDFNRDGIATVQESQEVAATIEEWGGKVTQELTGDVDFLVLGQSPVTPPQPPIDAPAEVIKEFLRVKGMVQRYEELFQKAVATSIPVLNESRLYTLTGRGL